MWSRSGSTSSREVEDVLGGAERAAAPAPTSGSRRITRTTHHASAEARTAAASTPSLASSSSSPSKARVAISSATVNPMPATAPPPASVGQLTGRAPPAAPAQGQPRAREDAQRLAHHVGDHDAQRHRRRERVVQQPAVEMDAGVGEREQRHDHVARPRVQAVLEPFVGRDRGEHAELRRPGELRRRLLAERPRQLGRALELGAGWRIGADREARSPGRRSSGATPDSNIATHRPSADQRGGRRALPDRQRSAPRRTRRTAPRRPRARPSRDCRCRPSAMTTRATRSSTTARVSRKTRRRVATRRQQREDAEGERRVGRHGHAPAVGAGAPAVEADEDRHGQRHPADRGHHRRRHAAAARAAPPCRTPAWPRARRRRRRTSSARR